MAVELGRGILGKDKEGCVMDGEHGKQHVGNPTRICAPKIRIRVSSRAVLIFCFSSKRGLASVRRERATALHGLAECSSRRPDTGKHSDST